MVMVKMVKMWFGFGHFAHYNNKYKYLFYSAGFDIVESAFWPNDHDHDREMWKILNVRKIVCYLFENRNLNVVPLQRIWRCTKSAHCTSVTNPEETGVNPDMPKQPRYVKLKILNAHENELVNSQDGATNHCYHHHLYRGNDCRTVVHVAPQAAKTCLRFGWKLAEGAITSPQSDSDFCRGCTTSTAIRARALQGMQNHPWDPIQNFAGVAKPPPQFSSDSCRGCKTSPEIQFRLLNF